MLSLWARSYFVSTAGNVSSQTMKRYVEMQGKRLKGVNLMVRKDTTPSYVLELEMKTTAYDRKILGKKTRIGKNIYNSCLGAALKRLKAVLADRSYRMNIKTKQKY